MNPIFCLLLYLSVAVRPVALLLQLDIGTAGSLILSALDIDLDVPLTLAHNMDYVIAPACARDIAPTTTTKNRNNWHKEAGLGLCHTLTSAHDATIKEQKL